jgi:serine/threonine protein kinase
LELGGGGFGKVYRGELEDGSLMAVKRMKKESKQGMREFINEVRLLGRLKHPNLVRLIGFCATDEEQLLCYEYMPNGNLGQHLRGEGSRLAGADQGYQSSQNEKPGSSGLMSRRFDVVILYFCF